jgi:hypothetical protein
MDRVYAKTLREPEEGGPKTKTVHGKVSKFDYAAVLGIFDRLEPVRQRVHVCWEEARPRGKQGKGGNNLRTAHLTGVAYGMWQLFLRSKEYATVEEFAPNDWKRDFQLTNKDKDASRLKAKGLFPLAPLARKGDHNRAEALLLAECLRRRRGREKWAVARESS